MSVRNQQIYFGKESNETKSKQLSVQKMVNMYAESSQAPTKGDTKLTLYNTSGLSIWHDFENDLSIYGLKKMNGDLYSVVGIDVYKITSNKTTTLLGCLVASPNFVRMAKNGTELGIVDEPGNGYVATSSTLTQITDPDYELSADIVTLDGYGIFLKKDSSKFFISALTDLFTFDATEFDHAFGKQQKGIGLARFNGYLWIFGESQTEIYQNTGNVDFPFELLKGATIDRGCKNKRSIAQYGEQLCWFGDDDEVYLAQGLQYKSISTYAISEQISELIRIDDVKAIMYDENGHTFYKLSFITDKKTFVYDLSESIWLNQESIDRVNKPNRWRVNAHEFFTSKNLAGDFESSIIWEIDPTVFKEGDRTIISEVISKTFFAKGARIKLDRLQIDTEAGVGTATGEGVDAQIMLQVSKDGGRTWGAERWISLGKIGEYNKKAIWRSLGIAKQFTFKIKVSDPNKRYLLGAYVDYEILEN